MTKVKISCIILRQCDLIRQNFTTLTKFKNLFAKFSAYIVYFFVLPNEHIFEVVSKPKSIKCLAIWSLCSLIYLVKGTNYDHFLLSAFSIVTFERMLYTKTHTYFLRLC